MVVGDNVERLGSYSNYTTGRTGIILEIDSQRAKVLWTKEPSGRSITLYGKPSKDGGIKTWCQIKYLKLL